MPELLDRDPELDRDDAALEPGLIPGVNPFVETDERAQRRELRRQIAYLDGELAALFSTTFPREGYEWDVPTPPRGPRVLPLAELERVRDDLAERLAALRAAIAGRAEREEAKRVLVERMLLDPARYRWVRVTGEEVGEHTCKSWHVRPRLGIIGMLAGWWHVKISSGCPLATEAR